MPFNLYLFKIFKKLIKNLTLQAEEEMNAAKSVYEGINTELKEELPVLFERSAIIFYYHMRCEGVHIFYITF